MKYLKVFENFDQNIISYLNDILVNIKDDGISVNIEHRPTKVYKSSINKEHISVSIYNNHEDINWGKISNEVATIINYLKSEDWIMSYLIIDDDSYTSITDPTLKDEILYLDEREDYAFYQVTMHFIKN